MTIGVATPEILAEMRRRGAAPESAVRMLHAEAKRRYPGRMVLMLPGERGGVNIVAL